MTEPRWTTELEELVAKAIATDRYHRWGYSATIPDEAEEWIRGEAGIRNMPEDVRAALAALADAGLLHTARDVVSAALISADEAATPQPGAGNLRLELVHAGPVWTIGDLIGSDGTHTPIALPPHLYAALGAALSRYGELHEAATRVLQLATREQTIAAHHTILGQMREALEQPKGAGC